MARHPWHAAACIAGVILLAAALAAIPAGRRPFWSSDEARVVLLARSVLEEGRWLVAELRGQDYLNKPQLFYWSVALASRPFGRVTESSAAIVPILAAIAAVAGVIAIGSRLWGWTTGALAGLVLATTPLQFDMAHQVLPDIMLSAWLVWALYFLVSAARSDWSVAPLVGLYACLTGALLSKGPAGLAGIAAAVVAVAFTDGVATLRRLRPVLGLGAVLVIAAAVWLVPYQLHSVGRFSHQVLGGHYVTWYLLGSLLERLEGLTEAVAAFLPWTVLLAAAPLWWRQNPDPARRRVVLWTATLWVLIGMSGTFRSRYVLPVLPGLALLTAEVVTAPVTGRAARALRWAMLACAALAAIIAVALWSPSAQRLLASGLSPEDRTYLPSGAAERAAMALLALAGAAALVVSAQRRAPWTGGLGLGLALAGMLVIEGFTYPVRYTRVFDIRPLAAAAAAGVPRDGVVFGHPDLRLSYDIYLGRRVIELPTEADVRAQLATAADARLIMPAARWEALARGVDPRWRVLASADLRERSTVVVGRGTP